MERLIFKILLVGDAAVGKSCILKRGIEGEFDRSLLMTIGVDFGVKSLIVDGEEVKLQVWDFSGKPHFSDVRIIFYKGAQGVIYVYDVTSRYTLEQLKLWQREIMYRGDIPGIIVGNKIDLVDHRKVTVDAAESYAQSVNMPYSETSAKENI